MKNKQFVLILLLLLPATVNSQNDTTVWFTNLGETTTGIEHASTYQVLKRKKANVFELQTYRNGNKGWSMTGKSTVSRLSDSSYMIETATGKTTRVVIPSDGKYFIREYQEGRVTSEGTCLLPFPMVKEGTWKNYSYATGNMISEDVYRNNRMISNKYVVNNSEYIDDVFYLVDSLPEFGNGESDILKFIYRNLQYPQYARDNEVTGKVVVRFVVMADGSVKGIELSRADDPYLAVEVLRVVQMIPPDWKPGIIEGKKVNVAFSLPVVFELQ